MKAAALPTNEKRRLDALLKYEVLDTEDERAFDELTELASMICGTPISLISLVDGQRQWFKSRVGLEATETPRELAFCAHAILQDQVFEVPNALQDERFADNPLVTDDPDIRFYAGAPLITEEGLSLGTLCVIDREPRQLTAQQRKALEVLARQVISQLELRLHARKLERIDRMRREVFATIAHDLRSPFNGILGLTGMLKDNSQALSAELIQKSAGLLFESANGAYLLLDELLQWYQQQTGGVPADVVPQRVETLVAESLPILRQVAEAKNVVLSVTIPDDLYVLADPGVVRTALRNLVSNAIKFSPSGAEVSISAERMTQAAGGVIQFAVSDQGKGVAPEHRDRLFSFQVSSQQGTTGESGKGLGLKLCADFIRAQGGKIWLDTENEIGTRILFTLPEGLPA